MTVSCNYLTGLAIFSFLISLCGGQTSVTSVHPSVTSSGQLSVTTPAPTCVQDNTHIDKWRKEDFPNPQIDIDKCGRNCTASWVCDPGHIISSNEADQLDELIDTVERSGACRCSQCTSSDGYNISVALVPAMVMTSGDTTFEARNFATYLKNEWNFEICENDIVILISRDDRKVYTMAGKTTYKTLSLKCIEAVYNTVKSMLSSGRYKEGLEKMIQDYKTILSNGNCDHISNKEKSTGVGDVGIVIGSVIGGFIVLSICMCLVFCICKRSSTRQFSSGHHHGHTGRSGTGFSKDTNIYYSGGLGVGFSSGHHNLHHHHDVHHHSYSGGGGGGGDSGGYSGGDSGGFSGGDSGGGGGGGGGDF